MAQSAFSTADLAAAHEVGGMLPDLERQDLVFAVLPDGEECLVKGRAFLVRIETSGRTALQVRQAKIPVPDIEFAVALEQLLGSDGNLERRRFGNMIYGSVGST